MNSNEDSSTVSSAASGVSSRVLLKDKPGSSSNYSESCDTNAKILREIAMTPTSGVLLDFAQLAVALPTIIWAETIPSCPLPFIESGNS